MTKQLKPLISNLISTPRACIRTSLDYPQNYLQLVLDSPQRDVNRGPSGPVSRAVVTDHLKARTRNGQDFPTTMKGSHRTQRSRPRDLTVVGRQHVRGSDSVMVQSVHMIPTGDIPMRPLQGSRFVPR